MLRLDRTLGQRKFGKMKDTGYQKAGRKRTAHQNWSGPKPLSDRHAFLLFNPSQCQTVPFRRQFGADHGSFGAQLLGFHAVAALGPNEKQGMCQPR